MKKTYQNNTKKIALITGASSGIGHKTAIQLLSHGYTVYGAARRTELLRELESHGGHSIYLDLTDDTSIQNCVNSIISNEGTIDLLINNAGYGFYGPIENTDMQEVRKQFEVNFFGLARLTQLVLPYMRNQKNGRIINLSSMGGRLTIPFGGWYHGTKYALESFSDSLRLETLPFNIKIIIIEPGLIQTDWGIIAGNHLKYSSQNTSYEKNGTILANYLLNNYQRQSLTPPEKIANTIVNASICQNPKSRYLVGKYSKLFVFLKNVLPTKLFDILVCKILCLKK